MIALYAYFIWWFEHEWDSILFFILNKMLTLNFLALDIFLMMIVFFLKSPWHMKPCFHYECFDMHGCLILIKILKVWINIFVIYLKRPGEWGWIWVLSRTSKSKCGGIWWVWIILYFSLLSFNIYLYLVSKYTHKSYILI